MRDGMMGGGMGAMMWGMGLLWLLLAIFLVLGMTALLKYHFSGRRS
jgi:tellurite resistance protein TehA-like permease